MYLDQLLLQYWFHGPLDSTPAEPAASNDSSSAGPGVTDVVAQVSASQFRLTCSDASPELGAPRLAWIAPNFVAHASCHWLARSRTACY